MLLKAEGITKSFGGLQALNEVSFNMPAHSIYGIIGPNGAGKTTLFNIITGLYTMDRGNLLFNGHAIHGLAPHTIVQQGIARTFQNIRLFPEMTALENVMVGRHTKSHSGVIGAILRNSKTRSEEHAIRDRSRELLAYVGLPHIENKLARELSYGDQRRLEIARALATQPILLALDEPAAGMNPSETLQLQRLLEKIHADRINILLIEHDVRFVMELCQRILVLDYGVVIAEDTPSAVRNDKRVIEAYLGVAS